MNGRQNGGGEFEMDRIVRDAFGPIRRDIDRLTSLFGRGPAWNVPRMAELLRMKPTAGSIGLYDTIRGPRGVGTIIGMTNGQLRVRWSDGTEGWVRRRDLGRP